MIGFTPIPFYVPLLFSMARHLTVREGKPWLEHLVGLRLGEPSQVWTEYSLVRSLLFANYVCYVLTGDYSTGSMLAQSKLTTNTTTRYRRRDSVRGFIIINPISWLLHTSSVQLSAFPSSTFPITTYPVSMPGLLPSGAHRILGCSCEQASSLLSVLPEKSSLSIISCLHCSQTFSFAMVHAQSHKKSRNSSCCPFYFPLSSFRKVNL